jgi:predicted negative regulator of RcsB-dependent stress response
MKRTHAGFSAIESLLILVIVGIIGFVGWFVYHSKNATDSTYSSVDNTLSSQDSQTKKNGLYFRNKYQSISDKDKCLDEYYAMYPENKPDNQKPGYAYLAPPCPGVPQ